MGGPQPENVLVCDFCGHRWQNHMDLVGALGNDDIPIDFRHCAMLLLTDGQARTTAQPAQQPVAYPVQGITGPMGMTGAPGRDGRSVQSAYVTVQQDGSKTLNFVMDDGTRLVAGGSL